LLCLSRPGAAEQVHICYNYDCIAEQDVRITPRELGNLKRLFYRLRDARSERESIRLATGYLYVIAGAQSPIVNDKARNDNEEDFNGRMDCIDHSKTTTAFLQLLQQKRLLKFHRVLEPVKRAPLLVNDHWSARIVEQKSGAQFVVDSWFLDHGEPATIYPLQDWLSGASPDG